MARLQKGTQTTRLSNIADPVDDTDVANLSSVKSEIASIQVIDAASDTVDLGDTSPLLVATEEYVTAVLTGIAPGFNIEALNDDGSDLLITAGNTGQNRLATGAYVDLQPGNFMVTDGTGAAADAVAGDIVASKAYVDGSLPDIDVVNTSGGTARPLESADVLPTQNYVDTIPPNILVIDDTETVGTAAITTDTLTTRAYVDAIVTAGDFDIHAAASDGSLLEITPANTDTNRVATQAYVDDTRTNLTDIRVIRSTTDTGGLVTSSDTVATLAYVDSLDEVQLVFQGDWDVTAGGYEAGNVVVGTGTSTNNLLYQATTAVPARIPFIAEVKEEQNSTVSGTIAAPRPTFSIDAGTGVFFYDFLNQATHTGAASIVSPAFTNATVERDVNETGLDGTDFEISRQADGDIQITNVSGQTLRLDQVQIIITVISGDGSIDFNFRGPEQLGFFSPQTVTAVGNTQITLTGSAGGDLWTNGISTLVRLQITSTESTEVVFTIDSISLSTDAVDATTVTAEEVTVAGTDVDITFTSPDSTPSATITITGPNSSENDFDPENIINAIITQFNADSGVEWEASRDGATTLKLTQDVGAVLTTTWASTESSTEFDLTAFTDVLEGVVGVTAVNYSPDVPTISGVTYWQELGGSSAGSGSTSFELEETLDQDYASAADGGEIPLSVTPPSGVLVAYNGVILDSDEFQITTDNNSDPIIIMDEATYEDDKIFIFSSAGETNEDSFKTIVVANQTSVVADANADTLTLVDGSEVTITTDADGDEITIASHAIQSLRVEDLTDYEAGTALEAVTNGADNDFLGADNLVNIKFIPAGRSSTPFGELHIEYDDEQAIDNSNIPVVNDFIGGGLETGRAAGTFTWSGTVYKRVTYITTANGDLQRLYVRLAADYSAAFGTSQVYFAGNNGNFQVAYDSELLEALDDSIILFDTTDEEWKPTQLLNFEAGMDGDGRSTLSSYSISVAEGDGSTTTINGASATSSDPLATRQYVDAHRGVSGLRVEDLTDYEAPSGYGIDDFFTGLNFVVIRNASYSGTQFGDLQLVYDAGVLAGDIPGQGDKIGGDADATSGSDPAWTGTVTNIVGQAASVTEDIYRVYVRFTKDVESLFGDLNYREYNIGGTETLLDNFEQGYIFSDEVVHDNSVILYDETDEDWKPTQLVGFDISTIDGTQVITAPETEAHLSFHQLEDYEPASQFVAADTTTAGEFFTTTILEQGVYRTASLSGTENGTLELLFADPGNEAHLAPLQLGTYIGGGSDLSTAAVWQGIIYEYRDFPAPNNQLRIRVRLTTAPPNSFLGNGNDIITLNNVTEEFERGYRTDAIDPLGNSIFAYDFEAKEWQPITTHGINFHTETIEDSAGNSVNRRVASVPVVPTPAVEDLTNFHSDVAYADTSGSSTLEEFFGSTLTDFSGVFQSAASTGTAFGQLTIYYSEIDDDGIRDTLETFTVGSYLGGGTSGGSEPTWLAQITSIAFAGQDGAATMVLRLSTDAPSSFGTASFAILETTAQLADIQKGYRRQDVPTEEGSVLVYTTYENADGNDVTEWVPLELVNTEIMGNQIIPSGTVHKRTQSTFGAAITLYTGNSFILDNGGTIEVWMYTGDDPFDIADLTGDYADVLILNDFTQLSN